VHLIKKWKEGWWSGSSCKSTCLASMMCWIKALVLPKKKKSEKKKEIQFKTTTMGWWSSSSGRMPA
jgi:hypothetical protein